MRKSILIISIALLMIGTAIAFEVIKIPSTDFSFNADNIIPPTKETGQEYAERMLQNTSISEITCNVDTLYCWFIFYKGDGTSSSINFKINDTMGEKEILELRDEKLNRYIIKYLNTTIEKANIGGNGDIIVKK